MLQKRADFIRGRGESRTTQRRCRLVQTKSGPELLRDSAVSGAVSEEELDF